MIHEIKLLIKIPQLNINDKAIYGEEKIIENIYCYYKKVEPFWETYSQKKIETPFYSGNTEIRKILLSLPHFNRNAESIFFSEKRYYGHKDNIGFRYSYDYKTIKNEDLLK